MAIFVPKTGIRIRATGSYLPPRRITSAQLAAMPGAPMSEEEILRLTGIAERRWVEPGQACSDLAIAAGRQILANAGIARSDGADRIDRLILSTVSPDHPTPATACLVQHALGLAPAPALDLRAACAGFLFALDWAARAIVTGEERVLALASEVRSQAVDFADRATFALFGDGAGGALLEPGPAGEGLLALYLASDGARYHDILVPAGGSRRPASAETVRAGDHAIAMKGGIEVFLTAVEGMARAADTLLSACRLSLDDIALIVPHQPNLQILDRLARYMRISRDRLFVQVERTGNASSASLPVALDCALRQGAARPGDTIMLLGGGGGYSVGCALIRLPDTPERNAR